MLPSILQMSNSQGSRTSSSSGEDWRSSAATDGAPGASDATTLADFLTANNIADPFADHDFDGVATIIEIATGTPFDAPSNPNPMTARLENIAGDDHLVLEFFVEPGMDDILLEPETSNDLASWNVIGGAFTYLGETRDAESGRALRSFRSTTPVVAGTAWFARLRASVE